MLRLTALVRYGSEVFPRRTYLKRTVVDRGLNSAHHRGDTFTDPGQYRSADVGRQVATARSLHRMAARSAAADIRGVDSVDSDGRRASQGGTRMYVSPERAEELDRFAAPQSDAERVVANRFTARDLDVADSQMSKASSSSGFSYSQRPPRKYPLGVGPRQRPPESLIRTPNRRNDAAREGDALPYTARMHQAMLGDERRRERMAYKYAQTPTGSEYNRALRKLVTEESKEADAEGLRERLIDEHGMYPSQRLDAYMLKDESMFPQWVRDLPPQIRDRVQYGGLGLTEDDEVLRQNLWQLSAPERKKEWARLKAAREYQLGVGERRLSPGEIRQAKLGIRRHYWLSRKRLQRATLLKQLELRRPGSTTNAGGGDQSGSAHATGTIDFAKRLALIAQHVELGVDTKGQWPLDPRDVARARQRAEKEKFVEDAMVTAGVNTAAAVQAGAGRGQAAAAALMGPGMAETLKRFEQRTEPFKRLSRRDYKRRYSAVMYGDQDERGRNYRKMKRDMNRSRLKAIDGFEGFQMESQRLDRVRPWGDAKQSGAARDWGAYRHVHAHHRGMPSDSTGYTFEQ